MIDRVRSFLRSRWDHLRNDRTTQLFLAVALFTLLPAYYYGQFLFRGLFLLLLAWLLVMVRFWRQEVGEVGRLVREAQPADPRPPHLIFFYLQLRNPFVSGVVFRLRLFFALNICLLLLNNPLWLPVVDLVLGFLFWFALATSDELYLLRRDGPSAAPVGSSSGAGWRTASEQAFNHVQKNPKLYGALVGVGAAFSYVGKSVVDGVVEVRSQKIIAEHKADLDLISEARKLELQEQQSHRLQEQFRQAEQFRLQAKLDYVRLKSELKISEAAKLSELRVSEASKLADLEVAKASRLAGSKESLEQPD